MRHKRVQDMKDATSPKIEYREKNHFLEYNIETDVKYFSIGQRIDDCNPDKIDIVKLKKTLKKYKIMLEKRNQRLAKEAELEKGQNKFFALKVLEKNVVEEKEE